MSEDKALTVTSQQRAVLFNPEYNGISLDMRNKMYPPVVNVLSSDKQFKSFPESKPSELVDHYGELFVRNDANKPSDLVKELTGTVVKIEQGHEVRDVKENKILSSDARILTKEEKAEFEERGLRPMNMIKVLLAMGTAKEIEEKMAIYKEKSLKGTATKADFPFAVVVIKGSSWGSWFATADEMDSLARKALGKSFREVLSTVFKFKVTAVAETGSFGNYYSIKIQPELNDLDEATAFAPYLLETKEIGLFYKVAERVAETKVEEMKKVFEELDAEPVKVVDADPVEPMDLDDENLPF